MRVLTGHQNNTAIKAAQPVFAFFCSDRAKQLNN